MADWQPIETAPEHDPILVWCPKINRGGDSAEVVILYRDDGEMCFWTNGGGNAGGDLYFDPLPTHWMPLPEPPTA